MHSSTADDLSPFSGPLGGDMPDLTDVLLAGERVCFVAKGRVLTSRVPRFGRWYIMVTNKRLILLKQAGRPARQQWHVALHRVESAYQEGVIRSKVVIRTQDGKFWIRGLSRFAGAQLVSWLVSPRGRQGMAMEMMAQVPEPYPSQQPDGSEPRALIVPERVLNRIEDLEADVDRLTKQLRFLEELLEERQVAAAGPPLLKAREG